MFFTTKKEKAIMSIRTKKCLSDTLLVNQFWAVKPRWSKLLFLSVSVQYVLFLWPKV